MIAGKRDQLVGRIQQRYGLEREQAQREVDDFVRTRPAEMPAENRAAPDQTSETAGKARRAG